MAVEVVRLEQKKCNGVKLISLLCKNFVANIFASVCPLEMRTRIHEGRPANCLLPLSTLSTFRRTLDTKDTKRRTPHTSIQQFSCCQAHFCIFWPRTRKNIRGVRHGTNKKTFWSPLSVTRGTGPSVNHRNSITRQITVHEFPKHCNRHPINNKFPALPCSVSLHCDRSHEQSQLTW